MTVNSSLASVLFIPHGGGPLPILGDPGHGEMVSFLRQVPQTFPKPDAIVVVSAHWEEYRPTLTAGARPDLVFDYYNFPPESYEYEYPAPGSPELASEVLGMLSDSRIDAGLNPDRGYDHGMFVPLMLMYPDAEIPCIQLSLAAGLDPGKHIEIGRAIAELRRENVLILGSGLSYHNMQGFMQPSDSTRRDNEDFDRWLIDTCCNHEYSEQEREERLVDWESAPGARRCHPREEHLIPLHVCFGAASNSSGPACVVFNDRIMGKLATGLLW